MPVSPCHQLAKDLKTAIDNAVLGRMVQSAGAKGRQVTYSTAQINEMIAYYNQARNGCPDAIADTTLIELKPLDQPQGTRGAPARFFGRGYV